MKFRYDTTRELTLRTLTGCMFLAITLLATGPATAQQPKAPPTVGAANETPNEEDKAPDSLFEIIFAGGFTGLLIVLLLAGLSIGAAALVIEHLLTIRHEVLMPAGLGDQVRDSLTARNLAAAEQACQQHPSFLAFVLRAGLSEIDGGWPAVEKAMEDATAEQAARLFRKIELLSVIGNIAPMVGLLGTVMGMGHTSVAEVLRAHGVPADQRPVSLLAVDGGKIVAVVGVRTAAWATPTFGSAVIIVEREVTT